MRRLSQKAADFSGITIELGSVPTDTIKGMRLKILREKFG
jgi:hypothetical protein